MPWHQGRAVAVAGTTVEGVAHTALMASMGNTWVLFFREERLNVS